MTREEQIQEAKDKAFPIPQKGRSYESAWAAGGFEMGAHWADENPNLESLWHNASEEPKNDRKILIADFFGNFWVCEVTDYQSDETWEDYITCYQVNYWAYVEDLLPRDNVPR